VVQLRLGLVGLPRHQRDWGPARLRSAHVTERSGHIRKHWRTPGSIFHVLSAWLLSSRDPCHTQSKKAKRVLALIERAASRRALSSNSLGFWADISLRVEGRLAPTPSLCFFLQALSVKTRPPLRPTANRQTAVDSKAGDTAPHRKKRARHLTMDENRAPKFTHADFVQYLQNIDDMASPPVRTPPCRTVERCQPRSNAPSTALLVCLKMFAACMLHVPASSAYM